MVSAENLAQKDPQRNQRRKAPIQPVLAELCQRLTNTLLRQDVGEGQIPVLKKRMRQELNLLSKPFLVRMAHSWAGLLVRDVLRNPISEREAFLAYIIFRAMAC